MAREESARERELIQLHLKFGSWLNFISTL